jgi:hypothetical protein
LLLSGRQPMWAYPPMQTAFGCLLQ